MYPYHHLHHMGRFHRGPSRLLWFVLGGLTATWWYKHKEADKVAFGHCIRRSMQNSFPDAPPFIPTREAPAGEVPQSAATNSTEAPQSSASRTPQSPSWPQSVGDIPRAINNIPPSYEDPEISFSARVRASMGDWETRQDYQWQSERDHLAKISRQATDAVRFFNSPLCLANVIANMPGWFRWQTLQSRHSTQC